MKGSTFRRCACRDPETGKQYGQSCPKLTSRRHGVWNVRQELPPRGDGTRRTFRRGGYENTTTAQADLDKVRALLSIPGQDDHEGRTRIGDLLETVSSQKEPIPDYDETARRFRSHQSLTARLTVGEWLDQWLAGKKTRENTNRTYESHVRYHLKPRIGHVRLDRLHIGNLSEMFEAIKDENEVIESQNAARREQVERCKWRGKGRPPAAERERLAAERAKLAEMEPFRKTTEAGTRQRIRATLRTALNTAIRHQLITFNPATYVELDSGKRPKPLLWTAERVRRWEETGEIPGPVMVWTPAQFGAFLDEAEGERLYALFHLIGFRGPRRGEAVGADEANIDLDEGLFTPAKELVVFRGEVHETKPKTDGSAATIGLDSVTVSVLRAFKARKARERLEWGEAWQDTGKFFTKEDGSWLHPDAVSDLFDRIAQRAGLPPINLRDLRHVTATVLHRAGADIHAIKEVLRYSTIALTSDTYTSLLPEVDREIAEKAAGVVPRGRTRTDDGPSGSPRAHTDPENEKRPAPSDEDDDDGDATPQVRAA
ncbi:tyrosine-type recombinase/integrase [Streptomyces litchfieldiae]|uniref:Tyrosine-type recombinase/integrase n=1 Tax=Streptomyces litchfieldiae TaxID=3075543 RepID=A0ABU2MZP0_9ACTN|nr:tyrosine-type recombinase/integrase [Streptomyces sp. DSM 44938]MDT0346738.1 tyrosine-type recombinase/integrase [Streptomyces sp. DSM 44938]